MTRSMRDEAMARRDEAIAIAMKRKEGYLGARVPKELRDRVMQRAEKMGVPVSILIRHILENAFEEEVSEVLLQAAPLADDVAVMSVAGNFDAVLGWGQVVLNKSALCTGCGVDLPAGEGAALGFGASLPVILCGVCKVAI